MISDLIALILNISQGIGSVWLQNIVSILILHSYDNMSF
jgi:hypothetical protein